MDTAAGVDQGVVQDRREPEEDDEQLEPTGAVTPHDAEAYLPEPRRQREGLALCLSGGGFRAALFHLGALRRLNELGVLSRVDAISSVSGGSVLSAFLAEKLRPWPEAGTALSQAEWESRVAAPFRSFAGKNLRTRPLLKRLLPWNWFRTSTAVEALQKEYERGITRLKLTDLPDRPRFIFSAAEIQYAVNWVFEKRRVGDYQVGYMSPAPGWPVAMAVAASSCWPPAFDPLPVPADFKKASLTGGSATRGETYRKILDNLSLSDAGTYDNLGLEPVWKQYATVLVSDGGATFDPDWDKGFFWRLSRYLTVLSRQSAAVRKRWLISAFTAFNMDKYNSNPFTLQGTYWGINTPTSRYKRPDGAVPPGYTFPVVDDYIAEVRTDFDAFSDGEQRAIEKHGYFLADAAVQQYARQLLPDEPVPFSLTPPNEEEEAEVRLALKESDQIKILGRRS